MKRTIFFLTVFLVFILAGCGKNDPDAGTGPYMEVSYLAGSNPGNEWNFLPYPAHFGIFQAYPTLLLTKANFPGKERSIVPIGLIKFESNQKEISWLVANDAHEDFKIEGLNDINDLMTVHNGIKSTLERWIANHQGIGAIMLKGWEELPSDLEINNQ